MSPLWLSKTARGVSSNNPHRVWPPINRVKFHCQCVQRALFSRHCLWTPFFLWHFHNWHSKSQKERERQSPAVLRPIPLSLFLPTSELESLLEGSCLLLEVVSKWHRPKQNESELVDEVSCALLEALLWAWICCSQPAAHHNIHTDHEARFWWTKPKVARFLFPNSYPLSCMHADHERKLHKQVLCQDIQQEHFAFWCLWKQHQELQPYCLQQPWSCRLGTSVWMWTWSQTHRTKGGHIPHNTWIFMIDCVDINCSCHTEHHLHLFILQQWNLKERRDKRGLNNAHDWHHLYQ